MKRGLEQSCHNVGDQSVGLTGIFVHHLEITQPAVPRLRVNQSHAAWVFRHQSTSIRNAIGLSPTTWNVGVRKNMVLFRVLPRFLHYKRRIKCTCAGSWRAS